ncbi:peptide ABC transporter ATP-binding protein [Kiloniella litopenaei]|uniref:Peptide ABC transporter ATP-binding protein n=1 Tax=Kiloniella litopenaei TaxID=1549748 RepID=A0A0M2RAB9_9PROT|nr:peptide ABC transporter ATP-binding protein [Kiloniella litopenaei]KKJ76548.1 peptide ABC transporter ATP-binding protein [Kiloniella litopenaei]
MGAETVLKADNLKRYYDVKGGMFSKGGTVKALDGATFQLEAGKTLAVVGESGCGKSTLARLVTLIEKPTEGELILGGMDIASAHSKEDMITLRQMVQIVFQDPYGSLNPRQKISDILAEPLKINTKMSASERREAVLSMMSRVGLRPEQADRYPHMFSGGQRQRIAVARALMLRPKIVILDEPVSALDVSIQAQVLNLLTDLQEEMDLAYLFISHDLSVVKHIADDVLVMYLGQPVEHGTRDEIFSNPQHPYTRALLSATPVADPNRKKERIKLVGELPSPLNPPSGCSFHPRCPLANDRCKAERPVLSPTSSAQVSCHAVEEGRS